MVVSRFQIQEMLSQDATRVVFLAENTSTGEKAALRRFLLSGENDRDSGVLAAAIDRLLTFRHPSIRAVLEGGVDEIDGAPMLVTEWLEGASLGELLENAVLSEEDGLVMVLQALGLLEALEIPAETEVAGIDFRAEDVVVLQREGEPVVTVWPTLSAWWDEEKREGAVADLADLAGRCCGVSASSQGKLAEWLRFVRDNNPGVVEARGALKAIAQLEDKPAPPPRVVTRSPFPAVVPPATLPPPADSAPIAVKESSSGGLWVALSIVAAVLILIGGGFLVAMKLTAKPEMVATNGSAAMVPASDGAASVVEEPVRPAPASPSREEVAAQVLARLEEGRKLRERTHFESHEGENILRIQGQAISVSGTVSEVRQTKKYLYFEFGPERTDVDLCIRMAKKSSPGKTLTDFKNLEGKDLVFQGLADEYPIGARRRVCLMLDSPDQINPGGGN